MPSLAFRSDRTPAQGPDAREGGHAKPERRGLGGSTGIWVPTGVMFAGIDSVKHQRFVPAVSSVCAYDRLICGEIWAS